MSAPAANESSAVQDAPAPVAAPRPAQAAPALEVEPLEQAPATFPAADEAPAAPPVPVRAIALFVIGLAASLALIGEALRAGALRLDANVAKVQELAAMEDFGHEILAIGDSTTLEGVDAEAMTAGLGLSAYNLATGGQSFLTSELVLERHLRRNPAPRIVLFGVYINRARDGAPIQPDLYMSLPEDLRARYRERYVDHAGDGLPRSYDVFNRLPAYRYRGTVDRALKAALVGADRIPSLVRGQARMADSRAAELGPSHDIHFDGEAIVSFLDFCEENGLRVAMFEPPNHAGYSALSEGRAEALAMLEGIAADRSGVTWRSFNDEGSLDYETEEWVGLNHLNVRGARRFTDEQLTPWVRSLLGGDGSY